MRRPLPLALLALAVLLVACGPGVPAGARDGETTVTTSADGRARIVEHPLGTTEIPVEPQVVVALDGDVTLEPLAALGVDVAAAPSPNLTGEIAPDVRALLGDDFVDLGPQRELDVERLVTLEPDVIVINPAVGEIAARYDDLTEIAPTVAPAFHQLDWRERLGELGAVFGLEQRAEELLRTHDDRAAEVAASLPEDTEVVSIVRARGDGIRYLTEDGSFPWTVLGPLGLTAPADQEDGGRERPFVDISLEQVEIVEADAVFLAVDGAGARGDGQETLRALEENPLFADLPGPVVTVPSSTWVFGSVVSAGTILDDVQEVLGTP